MPAQFTKHFVQDLTQDIKIRQCGTIVFNADNLSNVITVDLYNGTEPYSGGGTVAGAVICPDGATVPLTGTLSGNVASVTLKGDCFAIPGQIGVGVQVISGSIRTTVLKAIYNVELLSTDNMVDPDSRITASVGQLVSDIENAVAQIPASDMASLMAGIAPTFSASTNYTAGAYVYYNGTLYRFTADHTAGSWTGTDATAVVLGNDVADLKSALDNNLDPAILGWHLGAWGDDGLEYSSNNRITSSLFDVTPGTVVTYDNGSTNTLCVYGDDVNGVAAEYTGWIANQYTVPDGVAQIKVLLRVAESNPTIVDADISAIVSKVTIKRQLPSTAYADFGANLYKYGNDTLADIVTHHTNMLDGVTTTSGKYYLHGSIWTGNSSTAVAYAKIRVHAGVTYYYRQLYAYFCDMAYDGGTVVAISDNTSNSVSGYIVAEDDGYALITVHTNFLASAIFTTSLEVYNGDVIPPAYTPNKLIVGSKSFYVKKDGSGDFTTIRAAIAEACKYKNSIVYIGPGEYDLVNEFGSDLDSAGTSMGGLFLTNGVHLIGTPKTIIRFDYSGTNANIRQYWSVFNTGYGGCTLEGINIIASNIRYCVHDELNGYADAYQNRYINCRMEFDNSGNTVFPSCQCIGGGFGSNGDVIIDGCYFKTVSTSLGDNAVSWHNTSLADGKSRLIMKNCYIADNGRVRFSWHGTSTDITEIIVANNSFGQSIIVNAENASATTVNINVTAYNNDIRGN